MLTYTFEIETLLFGYSRIKKTALEFASWDFDGD